MSFADKEVYTKTVEGGLFRLTRELVYTSMKQDKVVRVPIGFDTDFASLPRIARMFINRNGLSRPAAVIHDYLYKRHSVSRSMADRIFLEAMADLEVNYFIRKSMYGAVRMAGWRFFEKNKDKQNDAS